MVRNGWKSAVSRDRLQRPCPRRSRPPYRRRFSSPAKSLILDYFPGGGGRDEAEPVKHQGASGASPVFISYASRERRQALRVTEAIESRGTRCWISTRDVAPGENYQEAIVRAIRTAPAVVLVFSEAANNSDEIKKELSLASRFRVPLIALRLENVEPSDAFAYELSTRQWIDAFDGWPPAMDLLVTRIAQLSGLERRESAAAPTTRPRRTIVHSRPPPSRTQPPPCSSCSWPPEPGGGSARRRHRRTR